MARTIPIHVVEPFSETDEHETENGTHVETGGEYLVKPTYIRERLPATCTGLTYVPRGLPGGKFERADGHVCRLTATFRFDVPEDHEYAHMDGKTARIEEHNLDFCVGTDTEIRRDRANCNVPKDTDDETED